MEGTRRGRGIGDWEVRVERRGGRRDRRSGSKKPNDEEIEEIRDREVGRLGDERIEEIGDRRSGRGSRMKRREEIGDREVRRSDGKEIEEIEDEVAGAREDVRTKYRDETDERNERNVRLHETGVNRERGNERRKGMAERNGGK